NQRDPVEEIEKAAVNMGRSTAARHLAAYGPGGASSVAVALCATCLFVGRFCETPRWRLTQTPYNASHLPSHGFGVAGSEAATDEAPRIFCAPASSARRAGGRTR